MITLLSHIHSLRWTIPCCLMMGSSSITMMFWGALRLLSAPLPQKIYRIGDDALFSSYMRLTLFFFHSYVKAKVYVYGDIEDIQERDENVIYLSNHQCTVDWIVACMLSEQKQCTGMVRYVMKSGLKYLPIYGFYCYQHSCVFVGRSGKFNGEKFIKELQYLKNNEIPVWLVIYPEGTRYNPHLPEVIDKSKKYALDLGFKELHHVLTPRITALKSSLRELKDHVSAVYDVTIAYSNTYDTETRERIPAYGMPDFVMGKSPEIHMNVERINIKDIPIEDSKLQQWCYKQFAKKDRILTGFYDPDSNLYEKFPGNSSLLTIKQRQTIPAFIFYTTTLLTVVSYSEDSRDFYFKSSLCIMVGGLLWVSFRS
ncbi:1-acyl-sn-glycerol-3-phosphate acyltransferase epsilon-like [Mytilus californianus]|uniref:1-acyl-sn-glycerol-3-phosphate acyltransferase epsilon-like n=1 Tax=Mytilus californianus TaxID=6549 RepID=UPI0022484E39|nr:1-acyl-sn-glycerol-3-phosphate acyltransferase epsilon-like [Mytilus californianus]